MKPASLACNSSETSIHFITGLSLKRVVTLSNNTIVLTLCYTSSAPACSDEGYGNMLTVEHDHDLTLFFKDKAQMIEQMRGVAGQLISEARTLERGT